MEAAYFDLDKTVIARASMVAFGRPLYRAGLVSRWLLLRALYGQVIYLYLGADDERMERMRTSVLAVTTGWDHGHVAGIVAETLGEVIDPIIYDEALAEIRAHQAEGRRVVIISASPIEIVTPLGEYLGVDAAMGTRARIGDDGRYTGEVEFYCHGANKAVAMVEDARAHGLDLTRSYAYSDSATDIPMLEAVGHPVVVNPDRELARVAGDRDWPVRLYRHKVPLRERVPMPPAGPTAVVGGGIVASVSAGVAVWWLLRREPAPPPRRQTALTFLAAMAARVTTTARMRIFFMGRKLAARPGLERRRRRAGRPDPG